MEKTVVIYKSKYGSTEQYARWIAEELKCDLVRAEDFKAKSFSQYDNIIFGGGLQAGGIKGLELIKKNWKDIKDKKIVIFAVGLSVDDKDNRMQVRDINLDKPELKGLTIYYCKGAYHPEQVKGLDKGIMKVCLRMLEGNRYTGTDAQKQLYKDMSEGADYVDKKYITPIVDEFLENN